MGSENSSSVCGKRSRSTPRTLRFQTIVPALAAGWTGFCPAINVADTLDTNTRVVVLALTCHLCHAHGHTSPHCIHSLRYWAFFVANHVALNPDKVCSFPMTSFICSEIDSFRALPYTTRVRYPSTRFEIDRNHPGTPQELRMITPVSGVEHSLSRNLYHHRWRELNRGSLPFGRGVLKFKAEDAQGITASFPSENLHLDGHC